MTTKLTKTLRLSPETHEKLRKLGGKDETFDQILNRLIRSFEKNLVPTAITYGVREVIK